MAYTSATEMPIPPKKVELFYRADEITYDRERWRLIGEWIVKQLRADMHDNILEIQIPADAKLCYVNLTDQQGLVISALRSGGVALVARETFVYFKEIRILIKITKILGGLNGQVWIAALYCQG